MNKYSLFAESIKGRVTMGNAIDLYAPSPAPKRNRIPCPIHNGKDYNLSYTDEVYHCFVCNMGGDVIHFVQHIFGLDFIGAIEKLNSDFNIGLPINRKLTIREQREAQRKTVEILAERKRREDEKQAYEDLYDSLWDEYARLDRNRIDHEPKTADEEFHPLYIEALKKIEYQKYLIDNLL